MIFKKTILSLSLCMLTGLAAPAPATPSAAVTAEPNLLQGVPAYALTTPEHEPGWGYTALPTLSDGDRIRRDVRGEKTRSTARG